jgi:L-cysteate sulfo-lyase
VQSNHARQTAAAAARLGLRCEILLEHRVPDPDPDYLESGNVLLDRLFGARLEYRPAGADMEAELEAAAERVRREGGHPYAIPGGGSNPVGALGYVDAALELVRQADARDLRIDHVVHATGSAGTQAGLLVGLEGMRSGIPVLGIGVRAPRETQEANVFALAERTASHAGAPGCVSRERVVANCEYVGPGYGLSTPGMLEAVALLARTEGILLDPVYSGKGMAGLLDLVRQGRFGKGQNVVFIHTGGSAGLFAYRSQLVGPSRAAAASC